MCQPPSDIASQAAFKAYNDHVALMAPFDCYVPKHHLVYHLLKKVAYHGSPSFYATWQDESLNTTLKASCRLVSQPTFERSVLIRMRELLAPSRPIKRPR